MRFNKGGSFTQTPDSLLTNDTVEVLLGLSEGPIKGPVAGPKSFFADGTQIVNDAGEPNFSSFNVQFWPGSDADTVSMSLGGFASPVQIGTTLAHNVPVVRQGVQTHITAVDFRVLIEQLYKQDTKGVYTDALQLKFEYKAHTSSTWLPCFSSPSYGTPDFVSPDGEYTQWYDQQLAQNRANSFFSDRPVYPTWTAPPADQTQPALATNGGNVYTWDTTDLTWFQLETTAGAPNDITFTDTVGNQPVTRHLFHNWTGVPEADEVGDIWDTGSSVLMWNGSAWVTPGQYNTSQYQPDPQWLDNGIWLWNGKVSSTTPVNIRVYVPDSADTYDFRVTKLTTDNTTEQFSVVAWESIEEIKQSSWTFTNLSMMKLLARASDQFSSLPQLETDAEGRIIKVPTNYDADARTYTGVWDGTYKLAYTNNPAWVFLDFIENTRYGLSSVYPHTANKWSVYAWAQYCDEMVPTADGGAQPRWTFNDWINQPRDAREMAQYIAGSAGGLYIDDGAGLVEVMVDQDADAVALFTPENTTADGFTYSYTDRLTRANEVVVSFANPLLNGATDKRRVSNDDDITSYGRISDDFIAVGCYDVDEALRRGRRRLISSLTEKETVTFTTNRKGRFLKLWDVILVADPDVGRGQTGRIHSVSGNTVTLRDALTLEAGFSYQAVFTVPGDTTTFATVTLDVTTAAGSTTTLTFSETPPANLPEYAAFSLLCQETVGLPKPYRVLGLEDDSSNGELVRVTALELNRNKYAYIDTSQDLGTVDYSNFYFTTITPPSNLQVKAGTRTTGDKTDRVLTLSWDGSTSPWVQDYTVSWTIDGSPAGTVTTANLSVDIVANRGRYAFTLVANGANGKTSAALTLIYDTVGVASLDSPRKVQLANGDINYDTTPTDDTALLSQTDPVIFSHPDAVLAWRPPANLHPNHEGYTVRVYVGSSVVRTEKLGDVLTWTYEFAKNKVDGLNRTFTLSVAARDQDGTESVEVKLNVNNPPPAAAEPTIELNPYVLRLHFTPPSDLDYGGVVVSMSATSGATNIVYQDKGNPALKIDPGQTYYVKAAFFDDFGTTDLNWSSEFGVTSPLVDFDSIDQVGTKVTDIVNTVTAATGAALTQLEADVNDAVTEARAGAYATIKDAFNLATNKQFSDAASYVAGQPVGAFAQDVKTTADGVQTTLDIMGEKTEDGSGFVLYGSVVSVRGADASVTTFNEINANIASNAADISTESTTRATAVSALSSQITTLTSTVSGNTAAITTEQTTRANAISSLSSSITTLNTNYGSLSSSLTSEASTRASADSAQAAAILGTSATLNGSLTQVYLTQAAVALVSGQLYGTFTLNARAGNVITSMTLIAASGPVTTSTIKFDADYFQIQSSSNPAITPFTYDATSGTLFLQNITVRNANIQDGAISTAKIGDAQITSAKVVDLTVDNLVVNTAVVPGRASLGFYGSGAGSGSYSTVLTCSVYLPVAGYVEVIGSLNQSFSGVPHTWGFQVIIDGTVVSTPHGTYPGDAVPITGSAYCAAGTRTVQINWAADSQITLNDGVIFVKGYPKTS